MDTTKTKYRTEPKPEPADTPNPGNQPVILVQDSEEARVLRAYRDAMARRRPFLLWAEDGIIRMFTPERGGQFKLSDS